jgi:hypothetical protein
MNRLRIISLVLILFLLGAITTPVFAADYLFQVESVTVQAFINKDGSFDLEYAYVFVNDPSAKAIDYIDIGTPNDTYDLSYIKADVNGIPITDIAKSDYVTHGVALGLGSNAIQPGQRGTVHVYIKNMKNNIFPGTASEKEPYASFQFSPNSFGSQYVQGNTNMTVTLILPEGMTQNEPRYFQPQNWPGNSAPDESGFDVNGRVFFTWKSPNANSSTEYIFGCSFPARLIPAAAITKQPAITFNIDNLMPWLCCGGFLLIFGLAIYGAVIGAKKRKLNYLPPKILIEGHGVKRGLTAIEAAILMEQPMDKVLTMILFSVVKKGAAQVVTRDPLTLKNADPIPTGLYPYETDFLDAFQMTDKVKRTKKLQNMMVTLVQGLTEKMKGFSRKESIAYYNSIMEKAWQQVAEAQTPEVKSQTYDEVMGWTMLDKDFGGRTQNAFGNSPVIVPMWWGRYDPTYSRTVSSTPSMPSSSGSGSGNVSIPLPTLPGSTFAASMINGVQNFSSNIIGDLTGFTGAVTNVTNPPPPPSSSSSGWSGGGGGHCACACACAGCACACAGGGR